MKNFELEHDELEELTHHKRLSLSWDQSLGLWATNNIICLRACLMRRTSDQKDLRTIYQAGNDKLDKNFDMLQIIQDLKYVKLLAEYKLKPRPEEKVQIKHCLENLIDLDQLISNP